VTINGADGSVETIIGTQTADVINGGSGADIITGGAGADNIDGGADNDIFIIGSAAHHAAGETITGGAGADTIRFTSTTAGETLTLTATVTDVQNAITVVIGDAAGGTTGTTALNVTAAALTGTLLVTLTGNDGANILTGTANNDTITGGGGNDTITGGAGNDELTGGAGNDTFVFAANATLNGTDAITDFVSGADRLNVDAMTAATTATNVAGVQTATAGVFYYLGGQGAGAADSIANSVTALAAAGTWNDTAATVYILVSDNNSAALYQYTGDGANDDFTAAEFTLVGQTVGVVVAGDLLFA
jgi:Ca2+-binding RTX toxin-like protein